MKKSITIISLIFILIATFFLLFFLWFYPIKHKNLVIHYSAKYNLDPTLVASIINVESSFNKSIISKAGAMGLMQILPSTAEEVATKIGLQNFEYLMLFNEEVNLEIGCYYFRYLLDLFDNDEKLALCSYNAGYNNVLDWLNDDRYSNNGELIVIPFKETNNYIQKISRNKRVYKVIF